MGGAWRGGGNVTEEERRKRKIHLLKWLLFLALKLGMIFGFVTDHILSVHMQSIMLETSIVFVAIVLLCLERVGN